MRKIFKIEVFIGYLLVMLLFYGIYNLYPLLYKSSGLGANDISGQAPAGYEYMSTFFVAVMVSATSLLAAAFCGKQFPTYRNSFSVVFVIAVIALLVVTLSS